MTATLSPLRGASAAPEDASHRLSDLRLGLFARMWALAALFHLAGNAREALAPGLTTLAVVQLLVGASAIWVLLRPRRVAALISLCVLVPLSAWFEAPVVGNHWVLAAVVSLAFMASVLLARRDPGSDAGSRIWQLFSPTARLVFLIAYGFAAFAKLNSGFFNPEVSCAVFYHDQLMGSWGLTGLQVAGNPVLGRAVAAAAVAVELSVPVLLAVPRLRRKGLLLALAFHWLLALDLHQHFWDFSAVLFAGFFLFADDEQVDALVAALRRLRDGIRRPTRRALSGFGLIVAAVVTVGSVTPTSSVPVRVLPVLLGHAGWMLLGTGLLILVARSTAGTRASPDRRAFRIPSAALLVLPLLVALNGLTPYLELKTGFGWNMYSNLRTVAGETNHFLTPATLDVTGLQRDQVTILDSSDPKLAASSAQHYTMVWSELREYAASNPEASITYRRGNRTYEVPRAGDVPQLVGGMSVLSRRLQPFRLVDQSAAERCLTHFTAGR